jgi:hypothetical protein
MNKEQWLKNLAEFIVEANMNTWAVDGAEVKPERKGFKELEYSRGEWRLRDSYSGFFSAPGMTTVYFKEQPAWTMAYGGKGQVEEFYDIAKTTFKFLKKALMNVKPEMPFRGPENYHENYHGEDWNYNFMLVGDITDFLGEEKIFKSDVLVFTQNILGGLVISKDSEGKPICPWDF